MCFCVREKRFGKLKKKRRELQTGRGRGPSVAFARKSVFAATVDVFHIVATNVSGRCCVSSQRGCCAFVWFGFFFHFLKFLLQKEFQHLFNKSDKGLQTQQNDELSCSSRDWRGFSWLTGSCILNTRFPSKRSTASPSQQTQHKATIDRGFVCLFVFNLSSVGACRQKRILKR